MTEKSYKKVSAAFEKTERSVKIFEFINKALTFAVYIAYPSLLIYLLLFEKDKLIRSIFVPAIMLVFVSVLRKIINRPRPYEALNITPIIKKDKSGESMPSRHAFSVFMIAMTFMYVNAYSSIPIFLMGIMLCAVRVIGGVHYLSDVLVGTAIALTSGIIGFFVI